MPRTDSVFKRGDRAKGTKRWVAQLYLGTDPATGRPRYKSSYHYKESEAEGALSKLQEARRKNQVRVGPSQTAHAYLTAWVIAIEGRVEPATYSNYKRYVEQTLIPAVGASTLEKVTRVDAQALIDRLVLAGSKAKTLANLRGVARKAWNDAIDLQLLSENPWMRLKLPKVGKRKFPVWTPAQIKAFFARVGTDATDRNLYILAVFSGARAGELLALHREDIDFARGVIAIGRSVTRLGRGRGLALKAPKSDAGWRTITIHPLGMAALRAQLETVDKLGVATDLVFPQKDGRPRYIEYPRKKLQAVCAELKYPVLRFHDLRHQHAALLIALGVHAKVISERLGHSSIQITMDRYGHLMAGVDQDASDKLGKMLE